MCVMRRTAHCSPSPLHICLPAAGICYSSVWIMNSAKVIIANEKSSDLHRRWPHHDTEVNTFDKKCSSLYAIHTFDWLTARFSTRDALASDEKTDVFVCLWRNICGCHHYEFVKQMMNRCPTKWKKCSRQCWVSLKRMREQLNTS